MICSFLSILTVRGNKNAAVQHENTPHSLYYLLWKITKINRSAGSERAWLTGAGQQAAGRSVATVKKDSGRIRSADVAVLRGSFNDVLRPFLWKDKHELQWVINLKLWATVVRLSRSLFRTLETEEQSLAQTIYSHGSLLLPWSCTRTHTDTHQTHNCRSVQHRKRVNSTGTADGILNVYLPLLLQCFRGLRSMALSAFHCSDFHTDCALSWFLSRLHG